ncbi:YcgN family cysteine cluster protein [Permianibacter sp. IMCC34836]|uniref:YcgN family cysteine cluster protein n=1 Tax=Permianibacter fluminis TaxID=2738515 RepID=UPI0015529A0D|nr:YcgN family cysteine cluster protein [Permianibacter fluminis]NQD38847.1 YcgN family cysteine cluster protein [Permianibacter fluminis]
MTDSRKAPFWESKALTELTAKEWESLCDGCGKCCTYKLEDHDTGELYQTEVCCKLLDTHGCQCSNYKHRKRYVSDCVQLTPDNILTFNWLPDTCGYVRVAKGLPLPDWHHLISGDREAVHRAGISVRDKVMSEEVAGPLEKHIIARFK